MTINVRPISLAMRFITLSDYLCIQHDAQDTACCVCPTETADICCVVLTVSLLWQNKYFAGLICFSCQLGISALSQWCYAIGTNAEMCRPECQNISTLVPKCPRTELSRVRGCQSIHHRSTRHTIKSRDKLTAFKTLVVISDCTRYNLPRCV